MRKHRLLIAAGILAAATTASAQTPTPMPPTTGPAVQAASMEEAGAYLLMAANCNDCHTQDWVEKQGKVPAAELLAGSDLGFRGPWGTTYAKNLRTVVQRQTEDQWVNILKTVDGGDGRPPMPWWNTAQMNERDLRAMYRYIKSLGPLVRAVPRHVPPEREPTGRFIWVTPKPAP